MTERENGGSTLFDLILTLTGLNFISDFRLEVNRPLIVSALKKIDPGDFALEEWQALMKYLTGISVAFTSPEEIRDLLCR